jgi:hypothetical protein
MTAKTETLMRAYFDAFNRHDVEGMLATQATSA